MVRHKLGWLCVLLFGGTVVVGEQVAVAGQAASASEKCLCQQANSVDGELPVEKRVTFDAKNVARGVREYVSEPKLVNLFLTLLSPEADRDARKQAASQLRSLAIGLPENRSGLAGRRQILRRVEMVEAGFRGLNSVPAGNTAEDIVNEIVLRCTVDFEDGGREFHGRIIHNRFRQLLQEYPGVYAALRPVFDQHFMDFNFRLTMSEPMASMFAARTNELDESVAQWVIGAWVTGSQATSVSVRADILPSFTTARWRLIGDGRTNANTRARKGPATVCTKGNHCFEVQRQMDFVGRAVEFCPATIRVDANNRNVGVATSFDSIPIARGIVRRIAMNQANSKRVQTERIAARQIQRTAVPKFEDETASSFAEMNDSLERLSEGRERYLGQRPAYDNYSTEYHLFMNSRTASPENLAATPPIPYPLPGDTLTLQVHESLVNAIIDAVGVIGEEAVNDLLAELRSQYIDGNVPNSEVVAHKLRARLTNDAISARLRKVMPFLHDDLIAAIAEFVPVLVSSGLNVADGKGGHQKIVELINGRINDKAAASICFRDCDPVRIRFEDDELNLLFHTGPRRGRKKTKVVPLKLTVKAGRLDLSLKNESAGIAALREFFTQQIDAVTDRVKSRIGEQLRGRLPDEVWKLKERMNFYFVNAEISDGWLTLEVGANPDPVVPSTIALGGRVQ